MAHDVFISHASKDKVVADAVCAALEAEKIRCWIAPRDIRSGENWAEAITSALKKCRLMVLIFSDHSNQSQQVANELGLAVKAKAVVVPFKIEDIPLNKVMEYYLNDAHWLDAMNPPTEQHIANLVDTVKRNLVEAAEGQLDLDRAKTVPAPGAQAAVPVVKKPLSGLKKVGLVAAVLLIGGLLTFGGISLYDQLQSRDTASEEEQAVESASSIPEIGTIVVTSTEDHGAGTLREALMMARPEDVITFDPAVFPPDNPATIYPETPLPPIIRGKLTINASNAGVIIDGSQGFDPNYFAGLTINSSDNIIAGLQIINCRVLNTDPEHYGPAGAGILIQGANARNNIIGGDRSVGAGPVGQGNLLSGNVWAIDVQSGASGNIITGNLMGTDVSGKNRHPSGANDHGMVIENAQKNIIGPDNVIAYNAFSAMDIGPAPHIPVIMPTRYNTVTANSIFNNGQGIGLQGDGNELIIAPRISSVSLVGGTVRGTAPPGSTVEIFSDSFAQGEIFEGRVLADESGNFFFEAGRRLTGPNITATATDEDGNTSKFSAPFGN